MTGSPAMVSDNGGGEFHDRLPIGTGRGRDQHVARPESAEIALASDQPDLSGCDLLTDRTPYGDGFALGFEHVAFKRIRLAAGCHRLRSRLDDVKRAVAAVLCPFHVHRRRGADP